MSSDSREPLKQLPCSLLQKGVEVVMLILVSSVVNVTEQHLGVTVGLWEHSRTSFLRAFVSLESFKILSLGLGSVSGRNCSFLSDCGNPAAGHLLSLERVLADFSVSREWGLVLLEKRREVLSRPFSFATFCVRTSDCLPGFAHATGLLLILRGRLHKLGRPGQNCTAQPAGRVGRHPSLLGTVQPGARVSARHCWTCLECGRGRPHDQMSTPVTILGGKWLPVGDSSGPCHCDWQLCAVLPVSPHLISGAQRPGLPSQQTSAGDTRNQDTGALLCCDLCLQGRSGRSLGLLRNQCSR